MSQHTMNFQVRKTTDLIAVHYTTDHADIGAKEIDERHRKVGFLCLGFHFVIRRDGTVETGRHVNVVGAHLRGRNHNSIGICVIGSGTGPQLDALGALIRSLQYEYPSVTVLDHAEKEQSCS